MKNSLNDYYLVKLCLLLMVINVIKKKKEIFVKRNEIRLKCFHNNDQGMRKLLVVLMIVLISSKYSIKLELIVRT